MARTVDLFFHVYIVLIFIRVIMSWVRPRGTSPFLRRLLAIVYGCTEPLLGPIRQVLPAAGGLDLSPLVALLLLNLARGAVWQFLTVTLRFTM